MVKSRKKHYVWSNSHTCSGTLAEQCQHWALWSLPRTASLSLPRVLTTACKGVSPVRPLKRRVGGLRDYVSILHSNTKMSDIRKTLYPDIACHRQF